MTLIAVTGYGQPEDKARTQAAGFTAHLVKPIDLPALDLLLSQLP
jgi:CheY-like chemotaxis protein